MTKEGRRPGTARPEVIAHRGASAEAPENTMAAFRLAVELGADGIELDVQFTADRVPVIHHDVGLRDPDPARPSVPIHTLRYDQVRQLAPVPTLDDVVEELGGRCRLYVELKDPRALDKVIRRLGGLGDTAAIHSFDHQAIAASARLGPGIRRGILLVSRLVNPVAAMEAASALDLWQQADRIDAALVDSVHDDGGRVIAWTVNSEHQAHALRALGVDGICTDDPRAMLALVR